MPDLKVNKNRDATASIGGYVYQIYQSLYAWINLLEGEILILEGAEDFDVHKPDKSVTTTQIKKLSSNLTLRSSSIVESINNFWDHYESNPDYNVHFRFLTTADAGKEKGDLLDTNEKGLEYWSKAEKSHIDLASLRSFLLSLKLNENIMSFIKNSSDDELREKLIKKIHWDLGEKSSEALEISIDNTLKIHGRNIGLNTFHSSKALPILLKFVADLLSKQGKKELSFVSFLDAFDNATLTIIPQAELNAIQKTSTPIQSHQSTEISNVQVFREPIPIVEGYIPRIKVVSNFAKVLQNEQVIFLHGSSGLGKTNLAYLISNRIGGDWAWAGFRGKKPKKIRKALEIANFEINKNKLVPFIVIDDLKIKTVGSFESELISLIFSVIELKGMIIFTSQNKPPSHLLPKIWRQENIILSVPYFDKFEAKEMVKTYGLQNEKRIEKWGKAIWLTTSGHPQLVHARVRTLSYKNWPEIGAADLIEPNDIEEIRSEARNKLVEEFPSDSTRTLAYRLSVVVGTFSKQIVKAVAEVDPQVKLQGEAFDLLVGPWIERANNDNYKVSPLLKGAAKEILSDNEIKNVHVAIANSALLKQTFDQEELGTIFFHAYLGKVEAILVKLSYSLISLDESDLVHIDNAIPWFSLIALDGMERIYDDNLFIDLLLRLIQFKIISTTNNRKKLDIVFEKVEKNLKEQEVETDALEIMAYSLILNTTSSGISSGKVINILSRLIDLFEKPQNKELIDESFKNIQIEFGNIGSSIPQLFFSFLAIKIIDINDFKDLITSLDNLSEGKRNHLLDFSNYDNTFISLLVSQGWLGESKKVEKFNTENSISCMNFAVDKSRIWKRPEITVACLVSISILYDEYTGLTNKALAILDLADSEFSDNVYLIHQRAKVLFNSKQTSKSLPFYRKALKEKILPDVDVVFAYRNIGVAEANKGDWLEAEKAFQKGKEITENLNVLTDMGIGLLADSAYSLWKQESYSNCLLRFVEVLEQLEEMPFSNKLYPRHLHATVRHIIGWIYFDSRKDHSSELAMPRAGMCSNQNPHKDMKSHKLTDISSVWQLLVSIEIALDLDLGIEQRIPNKHIGKNVISVEATKRFSILEKSLKELRTDKLIHNVTSLHEILFYIKHNETDTEDSLYKAVEVPKLPKEYFEQDRNWESYFVPILISCLLLLNNNDKQFPIKQWETDLEKNGDIPSAVKHFLNILKGNEIAEIEIFHQSALSVFILKKDIVLPQELWMVCFRLLNIFNNNKPIVEIPWDNLIIKRWFNAVRTQRFHFKTPLLICPEIEKICLSKELKGLPKIAKILLVSGPYLNMDLADNAKQTLKDVSKNNS